LPERHRLTEKLVKGAEPRAKDYYLFDEEVRGFGLVVYRSGGLAFVLMYRAAKRKRLYTIGRWPEWSVVAARERARLLRREVSAGQDPQTERVAQRDAPGIADLVDRYQREHLPRLSERNAADQRSMLEKLVLPEWRHRMVEDITPADVEELLGKIARGRPRPSKAEAKTRRKPLQEAPQATPIRANRCGEVLRKMFNLAVKWRLRTDNPAQGFYRRLEVERERFLALDEIERLATALGTATDQRGAAIVRICMLTGARLGEVRQARFEQFNLDLLVWTKPAASTKQRRVHRAPISEDVAAIVRQRRLLVGDESGWLFPGDALGADGLPKDQPVQDIRRFWAGIQAASKLPGVRIHDIRHTFASVLVSGGASLPMIGKLLGHSQLSTTQRYAHLADLPLRAGVDSVAALMRPRPRLVKGE